MGRIASFSLKHLVSKGILQKIWYYFGKRKMRNYKRYLMLNLTGRLIESSHVEEGGGIWGVLILLKTNVTGSY